MGGLGLALRGLAAEFFSWRSLLLGGLCSVAAWCYAARVTTPSGAVFVLVAWLSAFSAAAQWARDPRLARLLAWPVTPRALAWATWLLGLAIFALEFLLPQVVLVTRAGLPLELVALTGLAFAACWAALLVAWPLQIGVAAAVAGAAWLDWYPTAVAAALTVAGLLAARCPPRVSSRTLAAGCANYPLVAALNDQRVWGNAVAMLVFGVLLIILAEGDPLAIPLALALSCSAPVLVTFVSRHPDTDAAATMLGVRPLLMRQYLRVLLGYFALVSVAMWLVVSRDPRLLPLCAALSGGAAVLYALWESARPLRGAERDVLRHPRRLVVLIVAAVGAVAWFVHT